MSSTTAAARKPLSSRSAAKSRPRLIVIASPRSAGKAPFVVLVGALMLAGLLSLLMLHTLAAQDSFQQTSLQKRLADLTDVEQRLEQQVQLDSAPSALRDRAVALGMVPSVITHYRQLPNGRTVAREVPASAVTAPVVTTTTSDDATKSDSTNADNVTTDTAKPDNAKPDDAKPDDAKPMTSKHGAHHGAPDQ